MPLIRFSSSILSFSRDLSQDWNWASAPLKSMPSLADSDTSFSLTTLDTSLCHCFPCRAVIIHGHCCLLLWSISTRSCPSLCLQGQAHSNILCTFWQQDRWMGVRTTLIPFCLKFTRIPERAVRFLHRLDQRRQRKTPLSCGERNTEGEEARSGESREILEETLCSRPLHCSSTLIFLVLQGYYLIVFQGELESSSSQPEILLFN